METKDLAAVAAWFLNTLGVALLVGMVVAAAVALIGLGADSDGLIWLGFVAGPAATGVVLMTAKAPSQRRLGETVKH